MKVKANFDYKDLQLNRLVKKDEVIEVDEERAKVLTTTLYNGVPFCNVVEEQQGQGENDGEEPKKPLDEAPKENMEESKEEKVEAPKKKITRKAKVEE